MSVMMFFSTGYTEQYDNLIMEKVKTAPVFQLANDEETGIVETFTT
jgi:hypothetical protein